MQNNDYTTPLSAGYDEYVPKVIINKGNHQQCFDLFMSEEHLMIDKMYAHALPENVT